MDSGMNSRRNTASGGASVSGWTRRRFLFNQLPGRVAPYDGPVYFGPLSRLGSNDLKARGLNLA
jgi:hypothetical protein